MSKIGIPRTLAYFIYFPLWKTFFEELGHEVVLSAATSKAILDRGVKEAVNDACIPIKLYHGHAAALAGKADYIFCPRLVSVRSHGDFGTETFCPKFLGLPDMLRLAMDDLPEIIDVRVDLKKGKDELWQVFLEIGSKLGNSGEEIKRAFTKAKKVQREYQRLLYQEKLPPEALELIEQKIPVPKKDKSGGSYDLQVAVVGYPYVLYDAYINAGLLAILEKEKVKVYTQDMISDREMNRQAKTLPKSMFWYFSNRAVYGALHFMQRPEIEGVIHLTAFACGPDSMVDRLLEIESRRRGNRPYLSIAVDEHTGEAGVRTRLEAFVDMLRYRRNRK
ncbi:MAG: acyl-CoA dehydratase activase-related protein [Syntrophomonas sp.]|uniref:acyl-CoA dehydratase activase-related protein n=1 Tax=Syntrophomonas sp. TaxID=2053627 RepID=UPI002623586D|nr:acyl-CoA dehydratase activase-related protein [Syntrophomonas sp.]MDD2510586.1 acyl-CoA dehydratase activase-related protein [Syntrophomonas sp.]MDD3879109.1 acyl-CoA dehydratase activase-related protein [Syntrophomonas sp.]MDD4626293.1 acyl-CoA dehydratase activase-related protein [Syntrophomonas sp.]